MASEPSARVLLDLSYGALGYSGIPQETRLLLKVLDQCPGVDATGLIFGLANSSCQRPGRSGSRDRRLEYQAEVLFRTLDGRDLGPGLWNRLTNIWRSLRESRRVLFGRRARLGELDTEVFWDLLWRRWLANTLADGDLDLARRPVLLSDISTALLNARRTSACPPRASTPGGSTSPCSTSPPPCGSARRRANSSATTT